MVFSVSFGFFRKPGGGFRFFRFFSGHRQEVSRLAKLRNQDGALDWLGWAALRGTGGIYWAHPVFTVTILTGLALDYDIFLFARVLELRLAGFENRAAVVGALALTGPTITAAGPYTLTLLDTYVAWSTVSPPGRLNAERSKTAPN